MAIAFDAANSGTNDGGSTLNISLTIVSSTKGIIVVNIVTDDPTAGDRVVSSVKLNSTTNFTNIAGATIDSSPNRSEMWYLAYDGGATGAQTINITMAGICNGLGAGVISFTGVDQASPIDASTSQSGTGSPSKAITTVADNAFIAEGCLINTSSASLAVNSSQTQKWNVLDSTDGVQFAGGYRGPMTPANSYTESWNAGTSSANYVYSLISLKPFVASSQTVGEMMAARQMGTIDPPRDRLEVVAY